MGKMAQFRRALRSFVGDKTLLHVDKGVGAHVGSVLKRFALGESVADTEILAGYDLVVDWDSLHSEAERMAMPQLFHARVKGKATAVVSVKGVALYDVEFQPMAFSTQHLAQTVSALAADPTIDTIVLDIDSPGGAVVGTPEAADAIFAARNGGTKVVAMVNPWAASAAYWLASQANEIAVTPSGEVGSVGVVQMHIDMSEAVKAAGVEITYLHDGEHKVEGNPYAPLSDETKAHFMGEIEAIGDKFRKAIARGRGVSAATVHNTFGQGRMFSVEDAKRLGMIDRVSTPSNTVARFTRQSPAAMEEDGKSKPVVFGQVESIAFSVDDVAASFASADNAAAEDSQDEKDRHAQEDAILVANADASAVLLPKDMWTIEYGKLSNEYVIVDAWEYPPGVRYSKKIMMEDLPNDLITADDLARFDITLSDDDEDVPFESEDDIEGLVADLAEQQQRAATRRRRLAILAQ